MQASSVRNHQRLTARQVSLRRLLGPVLVAVISLFFAHGGVAGARTRVSGSASVPNAQIACFHHKIHRFTAETKPRNCELAGLRGEQNKFVRYPIQSLKWHEWGRYSAVGSRGILNGQIDVRVIAFRRVRCQDGRTFFSAANVVEPGNGSYYVVRLPTCEDDALLR
jgi:hypothetical protein